MSRQSDTTCDVYLVKPPIAANVVDRAKTILTLAEGWSDLEAEDWLRERGQRQLLNVEVLAGWIVAGAVWPR